MTFSIKRQIIGLTLLLWALPMLAQTSTINWTNTHQVMDGFGASTAQGIVPLTSIQQTFFFNTLGLSIYRVGIPDGSAAFPGDCSTISISCAGIFTADMQAQVAAGGIVYATPWSAPAAYTTNGSVDCTAGAGNGSLATGHYADYATWLSNFIQSVQTYAGVTITAMSVQNEPDGCQNYDSMLWTSAQFDTFVVNNLGPTFASKGITTKIFLPESSQYSSISGANGGTTCMSDAACRAYIGGNNWHDYDAQFFLPIACGGPPYTPVACGTQETDPWASFNLKWWETEVSGCTTGCGPFPPGCTQGEWCPTIADALMYGAIIDNRVGVGNANAYIYWQYSAAFEGTNAALVYPGGTSDFPTSTSIRAYVFGQFSKFVRPGYIRIDATHIPQTGVTVTAYNNGTGNTIAIVALNQNASSVSQTFTITNAPTFPTLTPWVTSATQSLAQQSDISVSGNSFTVTLPAYSVTTFSGHTQLSALVSGTLVHGTIQ